MLHVNLLDFMKTSPEKTKSHRFTETRGHHKNETAEDYTELVADLIGENGEARVCDIARRLGVSHVTAIRTIKRLTEQGYVTTEPYRPILLTTKGMRVAKEAKERHEILLELLLALGVPRQIAEVDAEGAEHHISSTTLKCIRKFLSTKQ